MRHKLERVRQPEPEGFGKLKNTDLMCCLNRLPEEIYDLLAVHGRRLVLAGGYVRALVAKEKPRDIDLFVPSQSLAESVVKTFEETDFVVSDKAFSLESKKVKVQIVYSREFTTPEQLIAGFDYSICKAAIYHDGTDFTSTVSPRFYEDIENKVLRYEHPMSGHLVAAEKIVEEYERSIIRSHKFFELGYKPSKEMQTFADS